MTLGDFSAALSLPRWAAKNHLPTSSATFTNPMLIPFFRFFFFLLFPLLFFFFNFLAVSYRGERCKQGVTDPRNVIYCLLPSCKLLMRRYNGNHFTYIRTASTDNFKTWSTSNYWRNIQHSPFFLIQKVIPIKFSAIKDGVKKPKINFSKTVQYLQ